MFYLLHVVWQKKRHDNGRIRTYAPNGNSLAGSRLNHSATLSCLLCSSTSTTSDTQKSALGWKRKRQWQDLNLRIRRIIDFKSIALDHSATLSSHLGVHLSLHLSLVSQGRLHRLTLDMSNHHTYGSVAQMVEHSLCMRGAGGSIPPTSIVLFVFS